MPDTTENQPPDAKQLEKELHQMIGQMSGVTRKFADTLINLVKRVEVIEQRTVKTVVKVKN